jgi:hypothetical protein
MRFAVLVVCVAAVLVVPQPATAKLMALDHVELRGPGIHEVLRVEPRDFGPIRSQQSPAAVALEGFYGARPKDDDPPHGCLGERFSMTYVETFFLGEPRAERFSLFLYPDAALGPVTFTPPGQAWSFEGEGMRIPSGWQRIPRAIVRNLQEAGMPTATHPGFFERLL